MTVLASYVGQCCREWILAYGGSGRCGLCGQVPVLVRHYESANKKEESTCTPN